MAQKVIPCAVTGEYVSGDGVTLGAAGSHNSVMIEYDFRSAGPQWEGTTKFVLWTNPTGTSTNRVNLGTDKLVDGYENVYHAAPTADAMCTAGWAEMIVVGVTVSGDVETQKVKTEPSRFRVLPASGRESDNEGVAATVADQLQTEIQNINDLKVNKPASPYDPDGTAGQVLLSLGDGKTQWGDFSVEDIEAVLEQHPEWVTTVENGSISTAKLMASAVTEAKVSAEFLLEIKNSYVTPQMYGAKGDGQTNDTVAFQTAFQTAKNIYIPEGEYVITDEISLMDDTTVTSTGGVLLDRRPSSYDEPNGLFRGDQAENIRVSGVTIQGTGALTAPSTNKLDFFFFECRNVHIENVAILESSSAYGILFAGCDYTTVVHCVIDNYGYMAIGNAGAGNHCSILYNRITNATATSIGPNNNYAISLNTYGVYEEDPTEFSYGGIDLKAIGNYCRDENPTWEYIDAHGGTDVIVQNNVLENAAAGIACFGDDTRNFGLKNLVISGNIIRGCDDETLGTQGIVCGGLNVTVADNLISDTDIGIRARGIDGATIHANVIKNAASQGMELTGVNNARIYDNQITGPGMDAANTYGIRCVNSAYKDTYIHSNSVRGCSTGYRSPTGFTGNDNYLKFYDNFYAEVTTGFSFSAVAGVVPQASGSIPTAFTAARWGDVVLNSAWDGSNAYSWIFSGNDWIEH